MTDIDHLEADGGLCQLVRTQEETGLNRAERRKVARLQACDPQTVATLDGDATLVETTIKAALFSYQGFRACHPCTLWWAESA